jgi:acetyl-CoA carboxylase biotin carboxyl carrier protein
MNITEIQDLIKFVSKSGVNEVEIEQKDFKITIKADPLRKRRGQPEMIQQVPVLQQIPVAAAPTMAAAPAPAAPPAAAEEDSKYVTVNSPMIGTFYRSSGPDKSAFIGVGDDIAPGKVICIIEAMKLFNEIEAEVSGKIVKVLVDDNTPVEYDQPLFLIDPA